MPSQAQVTPKIPRETQHKLIYAETTIKNLRAFNRADYTRKDFRTIDALSKSAAALIDQAIKDLISAGLMESYKEYRARKKAFERDAKNESQNNNKRG